MNKTVGFMTIGTWRKDCHKHAMARGSAAPEFLRDLIAFHTLLATSLGKLNMRRRRYTDQEVLQNIFGALIDWFVVGMIDHAKEKPRYGQATQSPTVSADANCAAVCLRP